MLNGGRVIVVEAFKSGSIAEAAFDTRLDKYTGVGFGVVRMCYSLTIILKQEKERLKGDLFIV